MPKMPYILPDGVHVIGFVVLAHNVDMTRVFTAVEAWLVAMAAGTMDGLVPVIVPVVNTDGWLTQV